MYVCECMCVRVCVCVLGEGKGKGGGGGRRCLIFIIFINFVGKWLIFFSPPSSEMGSGEEEDLHLGRQDRWESLRMYHLYSWLPI